MTKQDLLNAIIEHKEKYGYEPSITDVAKSLDKSRAYMYPFYKELLADGSLVSITPTRSAQYKLK